jgi:hypothetical protein
MRLYVAGPMTGIPLHNAPEFQRVAELWRSWGHDVVTPLELNDRVWQKHYGRPYDPANDVVKYGHPLLPEMYALDLYEVLARDGVVLLDNWPLSRGGRGEVIVAHIFNKQTFTHDGMRLLITPEISFTVEEEAPAPLDSVVTNIDMIRDEVASWAK